ncbi:hypothetical protein EV401DRAFT_1894371 [Pisolithus croceorrhizus]|nr:hypothetical protein EV401DRAFT_1894371 [Pisolithus croceorrhizus]
MAGCASFMPHNQIPKARLLCAEMCMTHAWFRELTISSKEVPQLWIETRRAGPRWPSAIMKMDLKGALPQASFWMPWKASNMCPDPIWFHYAQANKTGAPFKWNCQAIVMAYREVGDLHGTGDNH